MNRQNGFFLAVAILGATLLLFASQPIAEFLVGLFFDPPKVTSMRVGQIEKHKGSVQYKRYSSQKWTNVSGVEDLHHFDQLTIAGKSQAQLRFASGWVLLFLSDTFLTIEQYQASREDSPILISLVHGGFEILNSGTPGQLFIMENKKIYAPNQRPKSLVRKLILETTPSLVESAQQNKEQKPTAELPLELDTNIPKLNRNGSIPHKIQLSDGETLSSSYIQQVLGAQAGAFRRCQLNSARDEKSIEGSLLISFTIVPSGKVETVQLLEDQMANPQLYNCVSTVLERAVFKSFAGIPISLTYPIVFR